MREFLHIIAVAHGRLPEVRIFIQSWINQTDANWSLTLIHDGESQHFKALMEETNYKHPSIRSYCTQERYNDYGHSLRAEGLYQATGEYTLLTNADNYFVPRTVELLYRSTQEIRAQAKRGPDLVLFDMIHSHNNPGGRKQPPYNPFSVEFKPYCIDTSSAIVKTEIARKVGFTDKTHDGDQSYFRAIADHFPDALIYKLNSTLLVHN
jgi:hypothetical protein